MSLVAALLICVLAGNAGSGLSTPFPEPIRHVPAAGGYASQGTVFLRLGEEAVFTAQGCHEGAQWYLIEPEQKEYDQIAYWKESGRSFIPLSYRFRDTGISDTRYTFKPNRSGIFYLCRGRFNRVSRVTESHPLHVAYPGMIIQIAVRGDDSYTGYLMELFGTPFIIPPCPIGNSHQTDLRMGSDCAEFAVYGMRRMNKKIPYAGPKGIRKYLRFIARGCVPDRNGLYRDQNGKPIPVGEKGIRRGDIIHFGIQVSVFFEDRGIRGWLDKDDILMQSFGTAPHMTSIEYSKFFQYPLDVGRW